MATAILPDIIISEMKVEHETQVGLPSIDNLAVGSDGSMYAKSSLDTKLLSIPTSGGMAEVELPGDSIISAFTRHDGQGVTYIADYDKTIHRIDPDTGNISAIAILDGFTTQLNTNLSDKLIAARSITADVIDLRTNNVEQFQNPAGSQIIRTSGLKIAERQLLLVNGTGDSAEANNIAIWDVESKKLLLNEPDVFPASAIAAASTGHVFLGFKTGRIETITVGEDNAEFGKRATRLYTEKDTGISHLETTQTTSGEVLVSASNTGVIRVRNINEKGKLSGDTEFTQEGRVIDMFVTPEKIVTLSSQGKIHVFNMLGEPTEGSMQLTTNASAAVSAGKIVRSNDGKILVAAGDSSGIVTQARLTI